MVEIKDLKPFNKRIDVTFKVLEKGEPREVTSKVDQSSHKVAEAKIGDATGTIFLTLWDDMIEKFEVGKAYTIKNTNTSLFQKTLRVNIGRYAEVEDFDGEINVDESNDMSQEEHQFKRRPYRKFGGGKKFRNREYQQKEGMRERPLKDISDEPKGNSEEQ